MDILWQISPQFYAHLDNTKAILTVSIGVIVRGWIYSCRRNSLERNIKYRTGYQQSYIHGSDDDGTWSTEELAAVDCVPTESWRRNRKFKFKYKYSLGMSV